MTHVIKTTEHHTLKGGLTQESGAIVKEGVLKKLAIKSGRNWKKRYFTLRKDGSLTYKERKDDTKPKGEITLSSESDVRVPPPHSR